MKIKIDFLRKMLTPRAAAHTVASPDSANAKKERRNGEKWQGILNASPRLGFMVLTRL